ncbi:hypothetical protein AX14_001773 [Amanita brunnescens Koide BX004]|nr:hypothetical protein AX14_001773 [Amanita brunnescens Koide BX004]
MYLYNAVQCVYGEYLRRLRGRSWVYALMMRYHDLETIRIPSFRFNPAVYSSAQLFETVSSATPMATGKGKPDSSSSQSGGSTIPAATGVSSAISSSVPTTASALLRDYVVGRALYVT